MRELELANKIVDQMFAEIGEHNIDISKSVNDWLELSVFKVDEESEKKLDKMFQMCLCDISKLLTENRYYATFYHQGIRISIFFKEED